MKRAMDISRYFATPAPLANPVKQLKGLVLGYYQDKEDKAVEKKETDIPTPPLLLNSTKEINTQLNNLISQSLSASLASGKFGEVRMIYAATDSLPNQIALVGLGQINNDKTPEWKVKDNFRRAAALGVKTLKSQGAKQIFVDSMLFPQAVAEGAQMATYTCDQLKLSAKKVDVDVCLFNQASSAVKSEWENGLVYAQAQNIARRLAEAPANICTPTVFVEQAKELFKGMSTVEIEVKEADFCREKGMNLFLSVTQGSVEPPKLLVIKYNFSKQGSPLAYVGKGITFDSGGISIKPSAGMAAMKADMTGAATVVSSLHAIAKLNIPTKIVAVIPLCENMPSGCATKPGDVFVSMNGKSVEVDNTDAEGRLILADALTYLQEEFKPHRIVDLATLTGAMAVALGHPCCGVFSSSDSLYSDIEASGLQVGERTWRMPLWEEYKDMLDSTVADLKNVGGRYGGSCSAAAFLKEFVDCDKVEWAHMDIAGTMDESPHSELYKKGMMTGRPTRLLIELAKLNAKQ